MDKHKLILSVSILLGCIILGGFFYASQVSKQQPIERRQAVKIGEEGKNKNKTDYFQKKVECEKYKDKITKIINQNNNSQKPEIRDSNNAGGEPIYNLYVENNELKEIFYSPKVNSCLYLESRKTLVKRGANAKADIGDWGVSYETYYLIDALSNKEIDFNEGLNFLQIIHRGEVFHSQQEADDIINKYK